jgi:hypothetical protein
MKFTEFLARSDRYDAIDPNVVRRWMGQDWHVVFDGPLWFWMEPLETTVWPSDFRRRK